MKRRHNGTQPYWGAKGYPSSIIFHSLHIPQSSGYYFEMFSWKKIEEICIHFLK